MGEVNISRRKALAQIGAAGAILTVGAGGGSATQTDEYNVGTASPAAEQAARDAAQEVIRVLDWGGDEKTVTGVFTQEAIDNLENRPDVRYTEINGTYHAIAESLPWGVDRVDADVAHSKGDTGGDDGGSRVTIIDTGVDYQHADLDGNWGGGHDFVNDDEDPMDDNGHGTHVAGTADAIDDSADVVGVSTAASLHAAKVLDSDGSGTWSDVAAGIRWTAKQGHDVGNMSLGGSSDSQTVKDACNYAYNNGVLLVAAAGNDGPQPNTVLYPAKYEEVIAVSATNKSDDIARFSSRGSEVELAAPGVDIPSTQMGGGTTTKSGTSMASPHVAGAGGQLMDNGLSNTEARNQLQSTAEDVGLSSSEQGHGLVDVAAALGHDSSDDGSNDGGSDGDNPPSVDSLSLTEDNQGGSPHADFDTSWTVSDSDGDLDTVELTVTDLDDGETEDSTSADVSGSEASGTTDLKASHEENSGHEYEVELVVTDTNGNTESATATEIEDGT